MDRTYYLAIDIGASGGRHILGHMESGLLVTEEVYRFENGMVNRSGRLFWDTEALFSHVVKGMRICGEAGKRPARVGIDTWGVDYCLTDRDGGLCALPMGYRDLRTKGMDEVVSRVISPEDLYARTGIQKQLFNTIYQLTAEREQTPEVLKRAAHMLMMPDYLAYRLCGALKTEYTNATTTQLIDPATGDWDDELIDMLDLPRGIFMPVVQPGTTLGTLLPDVREAVGYDTEVTAVATHDTASAIMAVPSESDDVLYISSGTWSLMGTELLTADRGAAAMEANFTNEGGYGGRICFLKNIMGLWMIQSLRKETGGTQSYAEICAEAAARTIESIVDCNDDRFMAPESMRGAVREYCEEHGQEVPRDDIDTAAVIYNSLAACYADTLAETERLTGKRYDVIHIVGGGSNADYLNRLTAERCGRDVIAGPAEATATGNIIAQMIADGVFSKLKEARRCVRTF